jgi:hypothetical protein
MTVRRRALPPDPGALRALGILDEIRRTVPLETRPVVLSEEYLRALEQVEALPEKQDGADKTWVERVVRQSREHFAKARRIR